MGADISVIDEKWEQIKDRLSGAEPDLNGNYLIQHGRTRLILTKIGTSVMLVTVRTGDYVAIGGPITLLGLMNIALEEPSKITFTFEPIPGFRSELYIYANATYDFRGPRPSQ